MITIRITNNAAKGAVNKTRTRRQMKGDLSFVLLPGSKTKLSKDFEDVVLQYVEIQKMGSHTLELALVSSPIEILQWVN